MKVRWTMQTTILRKVGGSVMMTLPPAVLEQLHLQVGTTVGFEIVENSLMVKPSRPRYTLDELLAQCDPDAPITDEEREWLDAPSVGREII